MEKVKTVANSKDLNNILWYKNAPQTWDEGLPIGNGRLAAMVLNYDNKDVLTLNHEFLWTGTGRKREMYTTKGALKKTRQLLAEEKYEEATLYAQDYLGRDGDKSKFINRIDSFQPAGSLNVCFGENDPNSLNDSNGSDNLDNNGNTQNEEFKLCKRVLNIKNGVAFSERAISRAFVDKNDRTQKMHGTYIAHSVCENIFARWDNVGCCEVSFTREDDSRIESKTEIIKNRIKYKAKFIDGISFEVDIRLFTDGMLLPSEDRIGVKAASYLIAAVNIATDVFDMEKELKEYDPCNFLADKTDKTEIDKDIWKKTYDSHTEKFYSYMDRVSLSINIDDDSKKAENKEFNTFADMTTAERLEAFRNGSEDENIFSLYLDYGRYLLISSSVCGHLPANLQGKWNNDLDPAWQSDYHFDINLQMCYWLAENGNLTETTSALFDFIDLFEESGRYAAKKIYGCRGILLPLSSDCWGISTPESYRWDIWIGAAPWIAQHYYKHYKYTGDKEFLAERAYPYFKAVAEFYEDYLVKDSNGVYQILPSVSPENTFLENPDIHISLGVSSAMDVQLAYDCLTYAAEAAGDLQIDEGPAKHWLELRDKLPDFKIGSDGRLLEWNMEMYEKEPGHRHLSHLYGVFPSDLFTPERNKEQFEAAKKSLKFRLSHLGGHTGWSRAWVACLYARMGNGEEFYKHTRYLIDNFSTVSLLDLHPPRIFQIDGNLGGAEAIIQALVHCRDGKICVLPALPERWQSGEIKGIKTVGGHTVSFKWNNGMVKSLKIDFGFEDYAVLDINGGSFKLCKANGLKQKLSF